MLDRYRNTLKYIMSSSTTSKLARAIVYHTRTILILLLLACLGALLHSSTTTSSRDCSTIQESQQQQQRHNDDDLQIALVAVVSMQRSASTRLVGRVLAGGNPCAISLNSIFSQRKSQSGNAWTLENSHSSVQTLEPSFLVDLVQQVARRKCIDKLRDDVHTQCHKKCLVAFKEFDSHLTLQQHEYLWNHLPNLTIAVLERRSIKNQYESKWVAEMANDWDTKGSYWHDEKKQKMLPNIRRSEYYCKGRHHYIKELCGFEKRHDEWYAFVRMTLSPNQRVEVTFNDTVLDHGEAARNKIATALPAPFQELLTPFRQRVTPEIALVSVASMRRSASTSLLQKVLVKHSPCTISLGDVFCNDTDKSEDAWLVEGEHLLSPIDQLEPSLLVDLVVAVAQRKCADKLMTDMDYKCRNKCIVGFKEFREHLSLPQHEYLWNHAPNLTVVVLERDLDARWKSRWAAAQTGDWDTTGSSNHKETVKKLEVPPLNISESDEICKNENGHWARLCHFERHHKDWYKFVRAKTSSNKSVEVSFDDTVLNGGSKVHEKISAGLPSAFRYLGAGRE